MLCPPRRVVMSVEVTEMTIRLLVAAMLLAAPAAQPQADRDHMLATWPKNWWMPADAVLPLR